MKNHRDTRRPVILSAGWMLSLMALLLGCCAHAPIAGAQPVIVGRTASFAPETTAPTEITGTMDLAACTAIALEGHPKVAAARSSLAAAEDASRALNSLRIVGVIDREVPIRRQQACLGVSAAAAGVDVAEHDVVYGVARAYFTVLYAREQERVAQSVVERLSAVHGTAQRMLNAGAKEVTDTDVRRTEVYLRLAETRHVEAAQGEKRALAVLKEAIGRGPDCAILVPPGGLPHPAVSPVRHEMIALALARRGDLSQAQLLAAITALEVDAQGTTHALRFETFAAGADIHSRPVPAEVRNSEFRPGAVPPEMPTMLAGCRAERVQRAASLSSRAAAVAAVARNLVALETEDAWLRWEQATQQVAKAREAAEVGTRLAEDLTKDFTTGQKVKLDEVVNARVLAAQARSQYNEALFHEIIALADLERATAGGFCAGLASPPSVTAPNPQH